MFQCLNAIFNFIKIVDVSNQRVLSNISKVMAYQKLQVVLYKESVQTSPYNLTSPTIIIGRFI